MRMIYYSVSDTGILGKKTECSYQELKPKTHYTLFGTAGLQSGSQRLMWTCLK